MKLYNTLTDRVEPFEPRGKKVKLYVCGITPYDTTHLGHAFVYANTDILVRYLELRGMNVDYVQNVTDIDDDILRKAGEAGEDWIALGNRWTAYFIQDLQHLNILPPDHFPRATEMIPDIINAVEKLLKTKIAYQVNGNVYYSIDAYKAFGRLSKLPRDEMLETANQRGNRPDAPGKRDPLDFVLWQEEAPGEPSWDSPWGRGRPGWHIECSTMASKYLGDVVDIHGGGLDLCFPHHEAEIAQMEPVTKKEPYVRLWMHTAMVRYQGEKMSKSLGNLVMVRDLLQTYHPDVLRLYLASNHYRTAWVYDEKKLKESAALAERLREAVMAPGGEEAHLSPEPAWASFLHDMDNDLDTPGALDVIRSFAEDILDASPAKRDISSAQEALRSFCSVLGLRLDSYEPEERVIRGWKKHLQKFE